MKRLYKFASNLCVIGEFIAVAGVMTMVLITCTDVLGTKLFTKPVPGATELICLIQLATLSFIFGATQKARGHINVEMFVNRLNPVKQSVVRAFTVLLEGIVFVLLIYEAMSYGYSLQTVGEVTGTIKIPFYPFAYLLGVCLIPALLLTIFDFITLIKEISKHES